MRHPAALATPETECLLYATYWFRPILSELIGAAMETAKTNRARAPSGPVKVTITTQPHSRLHFFFRPTPCGSRQVVNQAGKLMQIGKFSELMQWQHSHMTKSRTEHGSIHNPLSCHRQASQPTQDNQTRSKNTKTNKPNTTQKTARPVISRSVHGHLKRIRRDDGIVSPLGLVWHVKTRANQQQHDNAIQICEPGSNNGTMRKPRLPTARSLEITECRPHGQHSHRFWTPSKSQQ